MSGLPAISNVELVSVMVTLLIFFSYTAKVNYAVHIPQHPVVLLISNTRILTDVLLVASRLIPHFLSKGEHQASEMSNCEQNAMLEARNLKFGNNMVELGRCLSFKF